ncbi:MFS transporter prlL [Rhodotorula toruloides]|nr:MFS transporter prlL [Rhodotorula toruloides]
MDSSVFTEYETDLTTVLQGVADKLSGEAATLRGEERRALLRRVERELEEADEIVEQMEIEMQTADAMDRQNMQNKLRAHKASLGRHKTDLKALLSSADRDDLLGGSSGRADHVAIEMDDRSDSPSLGQAQAQRARLMSATDKLADGQRRLEDSQRIALETEDVGAGILRDLRTQRDTLEHSRDTLCLCFGAVTIGSAFISNFGEFVGVRILLGIFEGGVIPGIVYLLTRFYTRAELAFRIGVFLSWGPGLSGAFGGLLAAGLLNAKVADLVRWEKIFVVEGIITMSLGLITIFTLPTSPEKTKWLNEEERALAVRRLEIEHLGTTHEPTTPRLVLKACLNWRTWLAVAGYSFINVIVQGTSIFLPTIINGLGKYSATQVQLRTVPPYIVASAWAFGISYCAWKTRVHGYFVAGSTVLSIVGYIMFLASKDPKVLYGASFLTFTGALPCGPLFLAWATANAGTPTARAVTSAIGNAFNVFSAAISCIIGLTCSLYASWENKQREAGRRDWRLDGKSEQEIKELGEMHPRYKLMS